MAVSQQWDARGLYLRLGEGGAAWAQKISDGVYVDVDEQGAPVGIEVRRPGTAWPLAAVLRRFPGISDEVFAELAAGYPFPPPAAEVA